MTRALSILAALSTAAAAIHFDAIGGHLRESVLEAVLFFAAGLLQMGWAMALGFGATRRLLAAGVVLNVGIVGTWALSRTVGIPLGAHADEVEPVGTADLVATLAEMAVIVWSARLVAPAARANLRVVHG